MTGPDRTDGREATIGGDEGAGEEPDYADRIDALLERARAEKEAFDPPAEPDDRAMAYLREGVWPAIEVYVDLRTAGDRLAEAEYRRLEAALDEWLALYARCYDVSLDPDVPVREAAEVFLDTHNVRDTAQLLVGVPERRT